MGKRFVSVLSLLVTMEYHQLEKQNSKKAFRRGPKLQANNPGRGTKRGDVLKKMSSKH